MHLRAFLLFGLAGPALAPLAGAQAALPPDSLAEVTVTAARVAVSVHEAPVHAVVVVREAIEASASRSVADALAARTTAVVRRYGPSGLAAVSLRGAGSSQTLVLLDGQRLADPQLGAVDLSLFPASLLESVEVVGGAASGLYGSDALGGTVHLRTGAAPGVALSGEAGAWGERRLTGRAAAGRGSLSGQIAAEAARSDGDYAVADPSLLGAPSVRRQGWDSRQASVYASLLAAGRAGRAGLSLWAARTERGLGGRDGTFPSEAEQTVGARQWDDLARLTAMAARPWSWGTLSASAHLTRTRLRYASPFPATDSPSTALDETGQTQTAAVDVQATADRLVQGWTLVGLAAGASGRADHPSLDSGARDLSAALGVSGVGRVGRLTLFPAIRMDVYTPARGERRAALSPQIGANVAVTTALRLRTSAARAFRMPTLNDRFWAPGGVPDLRPETGTTVDAGAVWVRGPLHIEATAFWNQTRDQIVWSPTDTGFWSPANVARTRSRGVEATAGVAGAVRGARVDGGAALAWTDARDLTTGSPLRYAPRWSSRLWAGVALGPVRFDLNARAVGARPTTASGSQPLPAHAVLDAQLRATRRLGASAATLGLALDNLLDARYESVRSYPMPPRSLRLRLTFQSR